MQFTNRNWSSIPILGILVVMPFSLLAQTPPVPTPPPDGPTAPSKQKSDTPPAAKPTPPVKPGTPKPYKEVVTAEAKSDEGMFTVHRIDDKILFEIPANLLGREMVWNTEIAKLPAGVGYGGTAVGTKAIRWTRRNNTIFLKTIDYSTRAETNGAIKRAIEDATVDPIIQAFPVEAEGKDKSAVIDVTRLLTSDPQDFAAKGSLGASGVDPTRSYVERFKSFPNNVEIRSLMTFQTTGGGGLGSIFGGPRRRGGNSSSATAVIHYSIALLPEKPMMGRLRDSRVGFFAENFEDYGTDENGVKTKQFIARYRLEKKDPKAALSEPVKPIVYYLGREVPEFYRPYFKKGVEDWQLAFEAAGFKNAIICKDAPTEAEDPNWDPEDVRYSVIRWAPTPFENAMGPHVSDPRTGEILSAHIIVWHGVLKLNEQWYFSQVGPLDPRASHLPLPKEVMGEAMRYVVSHEVGHTLGLEHNFKASSVYSVKNLRDKNFTAQFGNEASIMDYGRFNYVSQPGDGARLIPILGPYDKFAISWGYMPIEGAKNPDQEKSTLDMWAAKQITNPMLRFGNSSADDPTVQTEDLGNDPVEATRMGLLNLSRVVKMVVSATSRFGEDYTMLRDTYQTILGQRSTELRHVTTLVGGSVQTDYHAGRGDLVYKPVPAAKQAEAVKFLVDNTFTIPKEYVTADIVSRIESSGVSDRVLATQRGIMTLLLGDFKIKRLQDQEAMNPAGSYKVSELLNTVQNGIWTEIGQPAPVVDIYRRNLQRAYLSLMDTKLNGDAPSDTDLRPIARGTLKRLSFQIDNAIARTHDYMTTLHFQDSKRLIERILNPKK